MKESFSPKRLMFLTLSSAAYPLTFCHSASSVFSKSLPLGTSAATLSAVSKFSVFCYRKTVELLLVLFLTHSTTSDCFSHSRSCSLDTFDSFCGGTGKFSTIFEMSFFSEGEGSVFLNSSYFCLSSIIKGPSASTGVLSASPLLCALYSSA